MENKLSAAARIFCYLDRTEAPVDTRRLSPVDLGLYIARGRKVRAHDQEIAPALGIKVSRGRFWARVS